jgi:hypothetical protein
MFKQNFSLIKLYVGKILLLEVERVCCESNLDLVTWGFDVPITTMVQRLNHGEHKHLIFSFQTNLILMVLDG